jgi:hypothetical protein
VEGGRRQEYAKGERRKEERIEEDRKKQGLRVRDSREEGVGAGRKKGRINKFFLWKMLKTRKIGGGD